MGWMVDSGSLERPRIRPKHLEAIVSSQVFASPLIQPLHAAGLLTLTEPGGRLPAAQQWLATCLRGASHGLHGLTARTAPRSRLPWPITGVGGMYTVAR
jgi:hypothetical protein